MSSLFPQSYPQHLIARDGEVLYYGPVMPEEKALALMREFMSSIAWKHDEAIIFGKLIKTRRKVAWYGDSQYEYRYSGVSRQALHWTPPLQQLKTRIEQQTKAVFNSCLLNLYHNGDEGVGWHSDDEPCLGQNPVIASVSLGAPRRFDFKHKKDGTKASVVLHPGSLLVMRGATQHHWLHCIPKTKKVSSLRISLTFRFMHPPLP